MDSDLIYPISSPAVVGVGVVIIHDHVLGLFYHLTPLAPLPSR